MQRLSIQGVMVYPLIIDVRVLRLRASFKGTLVALSLLYIDVCVVFIKNVSFESKSSHLLLSRVFTFNNFTAISNNLFNLGLA